ncbi:MAG: IS5 family transposase [Xenococcaceae cyanobacterium MO_188.B19]|nr:IS5 family transposase [Xenococcaceae cyanobacterium MO_188.B19]
MKYCQASQLSSKKFKRFTGISPRTYRIMVRLVKDKEADKKKPGRPPELIVEEQVLIALQYWREYRSYYHIGLDWEVSESTVCRTVHKIENILIRSGKFSVPGKKSLLNSELDTDLIVMDVMESQIERPQKHQKRFYSGKQKEHTLKTQLIIDQKSLKIICLKHGQGKTHDFKLFKNSGIKFSELLKLIADKGYQGIAKIHRLSETPIKKPRGGKLTKEQKRYNRELNRLRIVIEHVNRRLKIFKILSYPYRNRHKRFGLRSNLIAGIYNYELAL